MIKMHLNDVKMIVRLENDLKKRAVLSVQCFNEYLAVQILGFVCAY